ncbi:MAG: transglutaminase-like domain-containing protein [Rikenellaceae bacterium]|nr:transglutaminase-like domain-containing protein [Rikenellaceae bacterium]
MKWFFPIFYILVFLISAGCVTDKSEEISDIETILTDYPIFSQKRKAAKFLLKNMDFHVTSEGRDVEKYRDMSYDNNLSEEILDSLLKNLFHRMIPHKNVISKDFLKREIELSFELWEKCLWKDDISFDLFIKYILPYSICSEPVFSWRKELNDYYTPLIAGITDPKEAFDKVYVNIRENFKLKDIDSDFQRDLGVLHFTRNGTCNDRSLYMVAVMRSLCIPSAFDFTPYWANYSTVGHSWVSYVGNGNEIYVFSTIDDSISQKNGYIDGSLFDKKLQFDDASSIFKVDSLKKTAKVFRKSFANPNKNIGSIYVADVSNLYGYNNNITLNTQLSKQEVYLCTFQSGNDWIKVDEGKVKNKKVEFQNLANDITCLPVYKEGLNYLPLCNPITIYPDGTQIVRNPDLGNTEEVILRRKYALFTFWAPNRWSNYIGLTIEGSDYPDFRSVDTLFKLNEMPLGVTTVSITSDKAYRYVRYRPPEKTHMALTDLTFYGVNKDGNKIELTGDIIFDHIEYEEAMKAFDKDFLTTSNSRFNWYWIGMDLGEGNEYKISMVRFCPWNDGNFIESGNEYELFYYDMKWISLGSKIATETYLTYQDVPKNGVLWLRNLTKGREERIFTYENGKQIWW